MVKWCEMPGETGKKLPPVFKGEPLVNINGTIIQIYLTLSSKFVAFVRHREFILTVESPASRKISIKPQQ